MAEVELGRFEAREGKLPPVGLRSGSPACVVRAKVFVQRPWWVYLGLPLAIVPYFILAARAGQRVRVQAPLCALHRFHWLWRTLILFAGLVLDAVLWVYGFLL